VQILFQSVVVRSGASSLLSIKTPTESREAARKILEGNKYRDSKISTPLSGPLGSIGRGVRSLFGSIGRFFGKIFDGLLPGGNGVRNFAMILAAVAVAVLLARFLIARKQRKLVSAQSILEPQFSSGHWDRLADEAYAKGDFREAIVFRFRSGIARLERGPQPAAPRQTNHTIATSAPATFPPLGTTFDAVRYGDSEGSSADAERAKEQWPNVVNEIRQGSASPGRKSGRVKT
jgi:hypothetical protein